MVLSAPMTIFPGRAHSFPAARVLRFANRRPADATVPEAAAH